MPGYVVGRAPHHTQARESHPLIQSCNPASRAPPHAGIRASSRNPTAQAWLCGGARAPPLAGKEPHLSIQLLNPAFVVGRAPHHMQAHIIHLFTLFTISYHIHHYSPLFTIIHHYSLIHHCSPLFTIFTTIHHYAPLFTIIHHYSQLFTYSPLFTIIHHYSPLSTIIHLFTIVHHYSPLFTKTQEIRKTAV